MAILKPDKTFYINGVKVCEFLLANHNVNNIAMPVTIMDYQGVTVHNTNDLPRVKDDAEQYTRATYNGNMNDVRVHGYCDDVGAWQNLPLTISGWHAGDGNGYGNRQTVAIECIMTGAYNTEDKKAEDNCARLAAWLLWRKGYGVDRLYTHTYHLNVKAGRTGTVDYLNTAKGSYKYCPAYILPHWAQFKALVQKYINELNGNKTPEPTTPTPAQGQIYRIRKSWSDVKSQIGAYRNLTSAKALCAKNPGYSVYDEAGKVVYSNTVTPAPQGQIYRIRKSWTDAKSQIGAYRNLTSAKALCAKNPGYSVYDEAGKVVYSNTAKQLTTGAKIKLNYAPFFVASSSKSPARNGVCGTYYVWSPTVINNRIRITTRPDWAGVSGKCTAWVPVSNCTVI